MPVSDRYPKVVLVCISYVVSDFVIPFNTDYLSWQMFNLDYVSGQEVQTEKIFHLANFSAGRQLIVSNAQQRNAPFVGLNHS